MSVFGSIGFVSPWLLTALAVLPALWWLLKVTPPAARRVPFPALRLLMGLRAEEETPARTPLWLAILRLILASLVVVALAQPLVGSPRHFAGAGPILMLVDDGWAAAPDWAKRQEVMQEILAGAERERRAVAVLTTAPPESGEAIAPPAPARAAEASRLVQALTPKAWPSDRAAAKTALDAALAAKEGEALRRPSAVVWICDGLDDPNGSARALAGDLAKLGPTRVLLSEQTLPHLLLPPVSEGGRFIAKALRPARRGAAQESLTLRAVDDGGHVLAAQPLVFTDGDAHAETVLDIPVELANKIAHLDLESESSAGSAFLLDERWRRRIVGLASAAAQESDRPLLGDLYYIKRALAPFSEVKIAALPDLLKTEASVIVVPDSTVLSNEERARLDEWIKKGGVLLRFAGAHMAESADVAAGTPRDELIPVALRQGGRALGGVMSWTAPMALAPFDEASPFAGLQTPADVTVQRQVLAEPSLDLSGKTWARLVDGTPLVTGERRGAGWLALFHITGNADWSNLPLSGLFVEMLHRVVEMAKGAGVRAGGQALPPYRSLDGFGRLKAPPIAAAPFDPTAPTPLGPKHPPGFYGNEAARIAVNLGGTIPTLVPLADLPPAVERGTLAPAPALDLKPWLWLAALALALIDLVISLSLRGLMPRRMRRAGAAAIAGLVMSGALAAPPAAAAETAPQSPDDAIIAATSATHLAYVRTGNATTDEESAAGLRGLTFIVNRRTAAELAEPAAINIEQDEILFYPLLYWPVSADQPAPSDYAVEKINQYLATGGIILFDTADAKLGLGAERHGAFSWDAPGAGNLRRIVQNLRIPPLVPVPADHVLTRSYYLMQEFPGRFAGATLWVAAEEGQANDGVSPVIVGGNDFAGAWALDSEVHTVYPVVPGGAMQREQAFRFGINLVMYALTGNYKADQVHVPAILERLGQ